jgi:acetyl-CoA carboxylase biotin carboxylase subunit
MTRIARLLVANRGEIAVRIIRACFDEGIETVLVASKPDRDSLAAKLADQVVVIGPASPAESYLDVARVVTAALSTGCTAIHPGYGFLSEQPSLAMACADNGLIFVGPSVDSLERGGDKLVARALARRLNIPVSSGSDAISDIGEAVEIARQVGLPVMIKAAAGGGGRGMGLITDVEELAERLERASNEAREAFGDGRLYLERYVEHARHIEVQILGDTHGNVVHLGERDCSIQRRYQKVIEEAPSYTLSEESRAKLYDAAVKIAKELRYVGAGTIEFLVDTASESFFFLEMNTRVQVEHPITELVTGVDIVRLQLLIAQGDPLPFTQEAVKVTGHAIEFRLTAEDPDSDFAPRPGRIVEWTMPIGSAVRIDSHCYPGYLVPPYYDSLLAKIIVSGSDRAEAIEIARRTLDHVRVQGVPTPAAMYRKIIDHPDFTDGRVTTKWLEDVYLASSA